MKSIAFLLILSLISCKKYERDTKLLHLRSPGARLSHNTWVSTGTYNYRKGYMLAKTQGDISFSKDHSFKGCLYPYYGTDGKWEFFDKKSRVQIVFSNSKMIEYEIICLEIRSDPQRSILELRDDSIVHSFRGHD